MQYGCGSKLQPITIRPDAFGKTQGFQVKVFMYGLYLRYCTVRFQNQIHAYINWVNAQLKKKPGRQAISDLTNDMKDGTAFADLIEVVCKLWILKILLIFNFHA